MAVFFVYSVLCERTSFCRRCSVFKIVGRIFVLGITSSQMCLSLQPHSIPAFSLTLHTKAGKLAASGAAAQGCQCNAFYELAWSRLVHFRHVFGCVLVLLGVDAERVTRAADLREHYKPNQRSIRGMRPGAVDVDVARLM